MLTPHVVYEHFDQRWQQAADGHDLRRYRWRARLCGRDHPAAPPPVRPARIAPPPRHSDIVLLFLLWLQLALGLATIPLSAQHLDGSMMMKLAERSQRIVTFRSGGVELLADAGWIFKTHMFLGMSIFLIFPFTRLVHVWSGFGTLAYVLAPLPGGACTPA